jgi:hypothetical protein
VTLEEALSSTSKRLERDVELAAWCGLEHDELGPFLDRLAAFDRRSALRDARLDAAALAERIVAILEAEEVAR